MKAFFDEPRREFGVREIAKIWKLAPATASQRLRELEREELLTRRIFRKTHLYRAADNDAFRLAKRHDLIKRLHAQLLPALNKAFWQPTVVLFGSAAVGRDTDEIDLLVLTEEPGPLATTPYEKTIKRTIDLFVHRTLSDLSNEQLIYNVLNGITIQGDAGWISESVRIRSRKSRRTGNARKVSQHSATRKNKKS